MDKIISVKEIVALLRNGREFELSDKDLIFIIRDVFKIVNNNLLTMHEGKLKIQNFGNILIRNGESIDGEKLTRYSYRPILPIKLDD